MSYYTDLGIDRNASQEVIHETFRRLARKHHPDQGGDPARFDAISKAFKVLSDPEKRSEYDTVNPQGAFGLLRVPELSPSSFRGGRS